MVKIALTITASYLAVVAFLAIFQRNFIYHPPRSPLDEAALRARGYVALDQPARGPSALWYAAPARPGGRIVVFLHGNSGDVAGALDKVEPLRGHGHGLLLVEYPGFAGVAGAPTETSILAMATAGLEAAATRGHAGTRVVLWGESLGTGAAVALATAVPVGAVILEAPFTSVADRAQEIYWWTPARRLVRDRFDNLSRIDRIGAPLLILHGDLDTVTPASHGRRLLEAAREPKRGIFYPGGGHTDLPEHGMTDAIIGFLATLPPATPP
ncbi:MAG: alpha/beta hydrolase [Alphaproteobacteria bacterium]|nr:alpha/beta hydrolase [Alphaproteobacteria bacterium]